MRQFYVLLAIAVMLFSLSPSAAEAGRRGGGAGAIFTSGQALLAVAPTQIPGPQGNAMTLCHLVDRFTIFFAPVFTTLEGYALSPDGCDGDTYYLLSDAEFSAYQASGMIPEGFPVEARLSPQQMVWGYSAWLIGAALLLIGFLRKRAASRRVEAVAIHSVIAMSNVAAADGHVDQSETHGMAHILSRIQGRAYSPERVIEMVNEMQPSAEDFQRVGQGLSRKDRKLVLQAALTIAVVDGEMHPDEYDLVSRLATQMKISGRDFRKALKSVSVHLRQPIPPMQQA